MEPICFTHLRLINVYQNTPHKTGNVSQSTHVLVGVTFLQRKSCLVGGYPTALGAPEGLFRSLIGISLSWGLSLASADSAHAGSFKSDPVPPEPTYSPAKCKSQRPYNGLRVTHSLLALLPVSSSLLLAQLASVTLTPAFKTESLHWPGMLFPLPSSWLPSLSPPSGLKCHPSQPELRWTQSQTATSPTLPTFFPP